MREKLAQALEPREACRGKGTELTMSRSWMVLAVAALLAGCSRSAPERPADLIVYGRVWTGDSAAPTAAGVAVRGGTIVAVGSKRQVDRFRGPATRVLDNGARSVVPGFGDSHTHFINGGFQLMSVDLRDAATPAEFVRRIAEFAKRLPKGTWILGGDWDHERWPGAPLPRKEWIDSVTPDHPVFVSRLDGHMGVGNSAALRLARITRASRAPEGGEIVRDAATGEITGLLKDNAMDPIWRAVPDRTTTETDSALAVALRHAAENGVTTIHSVDGWGDLAAFKRALARNTLTAGPGDGSEASILRNSKRQAPNDKQIPNDKFQTCLPAGRSQTAKRSIRELLAGDPRMGSCLEFGICNLVLVWTLVFVIWRLFRIWCFEFVSDFVLRFSDLLNGKMPINSEPLQ